MYCFEYNGNLDDWAPAKNQGNKPRMPIPASLVEKYSGSDPSYLLHDFQTHITCEISKETGICKKTSRSMTKLSFDSLIIWSNYALIRVLMLCLLGRIGKLQIFKLEYSIRFATLPFVARLYYNLLEKFGITFVVMTSEQYNQIRSFGICESKIDLIIIKVDADFYRNSEFHENAFKPGELKQLNIISKQSFIICMGDELRNNEHAICVAREVNMPLVRISQFGNKNNICTFKDICKKYGLTDYFLLQKISYPMLVSLLRKAELQILPVDSTWQPAGWTVTCESLVLGVPVYSYKGLVSRELYRLGISDNLLISVENNDVSGLASRILDISARGKKDTDNDILDVTGTLSLKKDTTT